MVAQRNSLTTDLWETPILGSRCFTYFFELLQNDEAEKASNLNKAFPTDLWERNFHKKKRPFEALTYL